MNEVDMSKFPIEINGQRAPYEIHGVTQSFFSIARFYGACMAFGTKYIYDDARDVLVREDIDKARKKPQKKPRKKKAEAEPIQGSLLEDA